MTGTDFEMDITPGKTWVYGEMGATDITITSGTGTLTVGTDYILSISKNGEAPQSFEDTALALAFLDKPGTYTVKAVGTDSYSLPRPIPSPSKRQSWIWKFW